MCVSVFGCMCMCMRVFCLDVFDVHMCAFVCVCLCVYACVSFVCLSGCCFAVVRVCMCMCVVWVSLLCCMGVVSV